MEIKQITVISGKGGTGKTTLTASLIPYLDEIVIADCDVDAPDLDILFETEKIAEQDFVGLKKPVIDKSKCVNCGQCYNRCKFSAITKNIEIISENCEGCGACELVCPTNAIKMEDAVIGKHFISKSDYGKIAHAKLIPGEDASGKLVSEVRNNAKRIAEKENKKTILIDGSPGIACSVISSITGVDLAIIVVEPTLSGLHDLKRVYELTRKFNIEAKIVINKWDLSKELTSEIEKFCWIQGIKIGLKIPFNEKIVKAIVNKEIPSIAEKVFFEKIGFFDFSRQI